MGGRESERKERDTETQSRGKTQKEIERGKKGRVHDKGVRQMHLHAHRCSRPYYSTALNKIKCIIINIIIVVVVNYNP